MRKTTRFDAADYLDTEERQVAYITAALETGDADFVRDALGLVARARGMGEIAKNAGLNRESLYKALGETGNPEFSTVMRIVRALGLTLSARPSGDRTNVQAAPGRLSRILLAVEFGRHSFCVARWLASRRWISPTLTRLRRGAQLPSRDSRRQRDEPSPAKVLADG